MIVRLHKPAELTPEQVARCRQLQQESDELASPFFAPEFTRVAAEHCPGVEVAVLRDHGEDAGFFPFQRYKRKLACPVAWIMNDFQGGLFRDDLDFDADELLRACGLVCWRFDHLPIAQRGFVSGQIVFAESPYIDLSGGFPAYQSSLTENGGSRIKAILRKERKLAREIGPLKLVFEMRDVEAFETLFAWKGEQLKRTGKRDPFQQPWVRPFLRELWANSGPGCRGILSGLYAGSELAAVHFGICSSRVLHWWVSAYNTTLDRYSPGGILLLRLAEHAAQLGIQRVDLGKGMEPYKMSFQSATMRLAEGAISRGRWRRSIDHVSYRVRDWFRSSPLHRGSQAAKRAFDHLRLQSRP